MLQLGSARAWPVQQVALLLDLSVPARHAQWGRFLHRQQRVLVLPAVLERFLQRLEPSALLPALPVKLGPTRQPGRPRASTVPPIPGHHPHGLRDAPPTRASTISTKICSPTTRSIRGTSCKT